MHTPKQKITAALGLAIGLLISTPSTVLSPIITVQPVYAVDSAVIVKKAVAHVTAYSCGGIATEAERLMNCPNGITATGTIPRPYITVACDRANLKKKFVIEGVGEVICEDTGGAIKGAGRFDLYVETVQEAREFGVKQLEYYIQE